MVGDFVMEKQRPIVYSMARIRRTYEHAARDLECPEQTLFLRAVAEIMADFNRWRADDPAQVVAWFAERIQARYRGILTSRSNKRPRRRRGAVIDLAP